jgi:branched-chain amino acid transport system ATP-binding protein
MPDALLEATGVRAQYGPLPVLHGIDFRIDAGEIVVILGANGAGKTTTIRAICGMVDTHGSIVFAEKQLVGKRPDQIARFGIAHVPQGRGTFTELSVADNLAAGAYQRRDRAEVSRDVARWYETFPVLGRRRDQLAGELSGGEQQMLMMSRPRLLLLDEPSLGLAPLVIRNLFERLSAMNRADGIAQLIVEQNANLALAVGHRAYVLETGEIRRSGAAAELRRDDSIRRSYLGM